MLDKTVGHVLSLVRGPEPERQTNSSLYAHLLSQRKAVHLAYAPAFAVSLACVKPILISSFVSLSFHL